MKNRLLASYVMYVVGTQLAGFALGWLLPSNLFLLMLVGLNVAGFWLWKWTVTWTVKKEHLGTSQLVPVSSLLKSYVVFVVSGGAFYFVSVYFTGNLLATHVVWMVVIGYWVWRFVLSRIVMATINVGGLPGPAGPAANRMSPSPPAAHEREVDAVARIALNIYEDTTVPGMAVSKGGNAPTVLNFQLPDSKLRYLMFCLSTVLLRCAHRMKNPDAVFNETAKRMIAAAVALKGSDGVIAADVDLQRAIIDANSCLRCFLDRWTVAGPKLFEMISPAGVSIDESDGDAEGGMRSVCSMLHDTESLTPISKDDETRLWPLACWITFHMEPMGLIDGGFVQLASHEAR